MTPLNIAARVRMVDEAWRMYVSALENEDPRAVVLWKRWRRLG
jgi:hypothetical protein